MTYSSYADTSWTPPHGHRPPGVGGPAVTLGNEVGARSNVCAEVSGDAWVDDVRIENPTAPADVTPPTRGPHRTRERLDGQGLGQPHRHRVRHRRDQQGRVLRRRHAARGRHGLAVRHHVGHHGRHRRAHRLAAKAYGRAGNVRTDDDTGVTVANGTSVTTSATFPSRADEDGYVKANGDGSSASVGAYETTYGVAVGRGSDGEVNKTVLSFDTSSVPDGATVTGAYVTVTYGSGSGNPWTSPAGNTLVVGVRSGCFGACGTEPTDWAAAPDVSCSRRGREVHRRDAAVERLRCRRARRGEQGRAHPGAAALRFDPVGDGVPVRRERGVRDAARDLAVLPHVSARCSPRRDPPVCPRPTTVPGRRTQPVPRGRAAPGGRPSPRRRRG